jgi:hypothetical protein
MLQFLITWVVLFFVFAALTSAIAGLGTVEVLIVALVTAALAVLIARHRKARRARPQG